MTQRKPAPQPSERGWRGSAELWLDAAHALLVEGGVEAVKVMALAERLGLSRTSFYWHFADREALLSGLVLRWQAQNTANLVARTTASANTIAEAVLNLFDCWVDPALFDSRLEFAMRGWALTDPVVEQAMTEADMRRLGTIADMFRRFGFSDAEAETRARTIYLTQVGYIALRTREDFDTRMSRIPAYVLTFTGKTATDDELAAFHDRHKPPLT